MVPFALVKTLEKLILAYDYSTRRKSLYRVEEADGEPEMIESGGYRYPKLDIYKEEILMGYEEETTVNLGLPI